MLVDKKLKSLFIINKAEIIKHIKPAKDTVVNFGVFFCHLKETENIENPNADINPNNNPPKEPVFLFPSAIIIIPDAATIIEIQTLIDIFRYCKKAYQSKFLQ